MVFSRAYILLGDAWLKLDQTRDQNRFAGKKSNTKISHVYVKGPLSLAWLFLTYTFSRLFQNPAFFLFPTRDVAARTHSFASTLQKELKLSSDSKFNLCLPRTKRNWCFLLYSLLDIFGYLVIYVISVTYSSHDYQVSGINFRPLFF